MFYSRDYRKAKTLGGEGGGAIFPRSWDRPYSPHLDHIGLYDKHYKSDYCEGNCYKSNHCEDDCYKGDNLPEFHR